jgi:hypothetical protein
MMRPLRLVAMMLSVDREISPSSFSLESDIAQKA